jgi:hypothetical protein
MDEQDRDVDRDRHGPEVDVDVSYAQSSAGEAVERSRRRQREAQFGAKVDVSPRSRTPEDPAAPAARRFSPASRRSDTTRAHPAHTIGSGQDIGRAKVERYVREPSERRARERDPTQRLVLAGQPGVDLAAGLAHVGLVNPGIRSGDRRTRSHQDAVPHTNPG